MGVFNPQAFGGSLLPLSIRARIVVAVTLQEVDATPQAESRAERHDEGLEDPHGSLEKCHVNE